MEETPVGAGPDLIDDVGLEVDVKRAGDVLARRGLGEEGAEAIVVGGGGAVNETTIGLSAYLDGNFGWGRVDTHAETVLDGVELPCESYDRQYRSTTHYVATPPLHAQTTRRGRTHVDLRRLEDVAQEIELTAGVTDLDTSLTDVD